VAIRFVALLRGINVGGHARVAMGDLRRLFEDLGHGGVTTYLQSGNVAFTALDDDPARVASDVEERITTDLGVTITVLLRTGEDLAKIVTGNPFLPQGADPTKLHVTFLSEAPGQAAARALAAPPGEPDELVMAGREVYLHCPNGYGRTKLNNAFFERRLATAATTRNWKTVGKLKDLAGG
jgi:uncharacterized protein (DUF1697 family)